MQKPKATSGLRHLALNVVKLEECVHFYTELMGMRIEWQPDPDNVYLTSGNDNLALHRAKTNSQLAQLQRLDHFGFIINDIAEVDHWYEFLRYNNVAIQQNVKTHRDGARSFYCFDPDGNLVQLMYHPVLRITHE